MIGRSDIVLIVGMISLVLAGIMEGWGFALGLTGACLVLVSVLGKGN